ncbi:MAG TPA: amino acid permease, partial [Thermoguttaceae bacterium]|nr:amino acid permease [Thermoguttaceae bacterium]
MRELVGSAGARIMSVFMIVALVSAASAMTMIGPRVYAAMARDGYLPKVFAGDATDPNAATTLINYANA